MNITPHKRARTTPAVRREIQQSKLSERKSAEKYGISRSTVRKWKYRDTAEDFSHRPHNLHATLLLPIDDLLVVVREFICPHMSRSALDRCLRRHGVSNLKYLPRMPDETERKYLFVGIDRATRWVYMEIRASKTAESARSFLKNLIEKAPFIISRILTDNGKEFTDRFRPCGEREPTGKHAFDQECAGHGIERRLIKPRRPRTNGMVECFNGGIGEVIWQTKFESSRQVKGIPMRYLRIYNHHTPRKNLGHITPVEALKKWRKTHPDLFKSRYTIIETQIAPNRHIDSPRDRTSRQPDAEDRKAGCIRPISPPSRGQNQGQPPELSMIRSAGSSGVHFTWPDGGAASE